MAHAKSYLRVPKQAPIPVYETRPATEPDIRKIASRLSQPSLDEIVALSKFQPVSFLLRDMNRKRVISDWSRPNWPVAIIDINPVEDWDEAYIWVGLTDSATDEANGEAFETYCRMLFDQLNRQHRQLLHYVAMSNVAQRRWLEQLGFMPHRQLSHHGDRNMEYAIMRRAPANV